MDRLPDILNQGQILEGKVIGSTSGGFAVREPYTLYSWTRERYPIRHCLMEGQPKPLSSGYRFDHSGITWMRSR